MKKTKYVIAAIVVVLLVISLFTLYENSKRTTFNEVVLKDLNVEEISSLQMIKSMSENEISITERNKIKEIIDCLSLIKLKESGLSTIEYTDSYWITLRDHDKRRFGITLYDNTYISIFKYTENQPNLTFSYKITNENEIDVATIEKWFNN